ncbi:NAD-dependent epimerase/dehydratase family protein [Nocardia sp. NBC_00881]|uniref:NAD-dependent epimerase/dehydratase family protein n=1 Tax=Nocardia sp. NBC_00881 TaxID=2975995 RepID=UPI003867572E|nr:NAD-dependent epimerase/dehydratase family protein [Nocardia sp. NBC_00881]
MAGARTVFHLAAVLSGIPVPLYGDGQQSREFTYVDDIVAATLAAAAVSEDIDAEIVNVGGGSSVSMLELIALVGRKVPLALLSSAMTGSAAGR